MPEPLSDPRGFAMFALTVVAQAELGTGGLRTWMLENLVPLLLLAVAVLLLWLGGSKGGNAGVMPLRDLHAGAFPAKRSAECGTGGHAAEAAGDAV